MFNLTQPSSAAIVYEPVSSPMTLQTGLTPLVDIGSIVIPVQFANYIVENIYVRSVNLAGTAATATLDIRTAASGTGSSILSGATALSGLTATGLCQKITPVLTSVLTAPILYVYQTVGSLNAGTIIITLDVIALS